MKLTINPMSEELVADILTWSYEPPYEIYNLNDTEEDRVEFLSGAYQAILEEEKGLFGYFCTGDPAQVPPGRKFNAYLEGCIDMGLGMNPAYVGQNFGYEFCTFIINQIRKQYKDIPIRLTVATFNGRAVHLYEKFGFEKKDEFSTDHADFMTMIKRD